VKYAVRFSKWKICRRDIWHNLRGATKWDLQLNETGKTQSVQFAIPPRPPNCKLQSDFHSKKSQKEFFAMFSGDLHFS
jgi:hypothetical protein